ncbi:conserved protein of unknown function [Nocardia cyriacigeorgica GUH-2]|uniref:Uncharacterized protein n=1 Tax=Nocardia cyriacigeorgica (strain GUH-2) TaxID=1127134 RepID=H6R773_NOCCG|nr:conserved protein of unknown function [Nocardia cyriacigeorgica GUH-2]
MTWSRYADVSARRYRETRTAAPAAVLWALAGRRGEFGDVRTPVVCERQLESTPGRKTSAEAKAYAWWQIPPHSHQQWLCGHYNISVVNRQPHRPLEVGDRSTCSRDRDFQD